MVVEQDPFQKVSQRSESGAMANTMSVEKAVVVVSRLAGRGSATSFWVHSPSAASGRHMNRVALFVAR